MSVDATLTRSTTGREGWFGSSPRLSDLDSGRDNNMDFMRFVAALMVIYQHSYHFGPGTPRDPLESVTGMATGSLAVWIFFCLSGYLVSRSLIHRDSLVEFVVARFLRIVPALVLANVMTLIVGAIFWTGLSQSAYWSNPDTWMYLIRNTTFIKNTYQLPEVFTNNPGGPCVNGSLWTIPVEVRLYGVVFVAGILAWLFRRWTGAGRVAWVTILGFLILMVSGLGFKAQLLGFFAFGMAIQAFREFVRIDGRLVVIGAVVCFLLRETPFADVSFMVWLPYACLWFAYTRRFNARGFGKYGDFSYGMYLFAFPITQWIYHLKPDTDPLWNAALTFAFVLPVAVVSWRLVEKPALGLKRSVHRRILKAVSGGKPLASSGSSS